MTESSDYEEEDNEDTDSSDAENEINEHSVVVQPQPDGEQDYNIANTVWPSEGIGLFPFKMFI